MSDLPIYVTQPYLPPLNEFIPYLEQIWSSKQLSNCGPMHNQLEQALCDYLGVPEVALFNNGTIALITALKAMGCTGEVITTPYTFVATGHSLLWNGLTPVFVDVDPSTLNLDPGKIEAAITEKTTAILPVHCYGNPCDVVAIQKIADKYNLKVIYDAAHAFGVQDSGGSILRHGDMSVLSFHATKVFNTFEGGAIICPDAEAKEHINSLRNFGIVDELSVPELGINGKMSEVNAAFGLLQLQHLEKVLAKRAEVDRIYRQHLKATPGICVVEPTGLHAANYSYFPILVKREYPLSRDELYQKLREHNVYARRYFYPLITEFPVYRGIASAKTANLLIATELAQQILCLPIYPSLDEQNQQKVINIINS